MADTVPTVVDRNARLYLEGFQPRDFAALAPNLILVEGVSPPARVGSIVTTMSVEKDAKPVLGGPQHLYFRVLRAPDSITHADDTVLAVKEGDEVVVRNAMLDPIHWRTTPMVIDVRHVIAVLR